MDHNIGDRTFDTALPYHLRGEVVSLEVVLPESPTLVGVWRLDRSGRRFPDAGGVPPAR